MHALDQYYNFLKSSIRLRTCHQNQQYNNPTFNLIQVLLHIIKIITKLES